MLLTDNFAVTGYLVALLYLSIDAANRGAPMWKSSVSEATFSPAPTNFAGTAREPKGPIETQQPMYPPQQAPTPASQHPAV